MGCSIGATDGEVGEVEDLYFDDQQWTIRYLVVETGAWLDRRRVLLSPQTIGRPDWDRKLLPASITTEQVKDSPEIDPNKPVSRQQESLILSHYRYPCYWEGAGPLTVGPNPTVQPPGSQFGWSDEHFSRAIAAREQHTEHGAADAEQHLRSYNAVHHYSVRARDGDIGQVHGILFADDDWIIRYLIVQTGHWWLGHQILVAAQLIKEVSWLDSLFSVELTRQTLIDAPAYNPAEPLDRSQEIELFEYFGRAGYWHQDTSHRDH
jgi:hypothetical protein